MCVWLHRLRSPHPRCSTRQETQPLLPAACARSVPVRRSKTVLGAQGEWTYEVGEPAKRMTIENDTMRPSAANPVLVRKDRPHAFEWRIRNLPYPKVRDNLPLAFALPLSSPSLPYSKMAHAVYLPLARLTLIQPYPSLCSPLSPCLLPISLLSPLSPSTGDIFGHRRSRRQPDRRAHLQQKVL